MRRVANPALDRSSKLKLLKGQLKVTGFHQQLPGSLVCFVLIFSVFAAKITVSSYFLLA